MTAALLLISFLILSIGCLGDKPKLVLVGVIMLPIALFFSLPSDYEEISESGYYYIRQSPSRIEYVKKHGFLNDGKITRSEFFSIPKDKTSKELLMEQK